jgi:hypothetical protein
MPSKLGRLLALSDSEFKRRRTQLPKLKKFKAKPIDVRKFDGEWQRERGAAVKLMAVVLREDSDGLFAKVSATPETAATFADAIAWLLKEGELLRKTAERHDTAAARLKSAVCRYRTSQQQQPQPPADTSNNSNWNAAGAP